MDGSSSTPWRPAREPRALRSIEPIYAQLLREWRDQGRTVPAGPEDRQATVLVPRPRR
ncbi:hypothetical protein ABTY98_36220 [Streptomyces sp. NPDC096040]|uniref:hypothetical protein n=1 Tax=Streptomyces sp. NPDC096040 TaxID=3155541 RepID=UPI003319AF1F